MAEDGQAADGTSHVARWYGAAQRLDFGGGASPGHVEVISSGPSPPTRTSSSCCAPPSPATEARRSIARHMPASTIPSLSGPIHGGSKPSPRPCPQKPPIK